MKRRALQLECEGKMFTTSASEALSPAYNPRAFPWGDLQTVAAAFFPMGYPNGLPPSFALYVEVESEVRLKVELTLGDLDRPLVVIFHGFTGDAYSPVVLGAMGAAWRRGYNVARVNFRNAGGTQRLGRGLFNLLQWRDVGAVIADLRRQLDPPKLFAIGISVGGTFLLNQLGRESRNDGLIDGAVAIHPPIDIGLSAASVSLRRNRIYMQAFVRSLRENIRIKRRIGETYPDPENPGFTTVPEYDQRYILPDTGHVTPEDYYQAASALDYLGEVRTKTLILSADDDPIVPPAMFEGMNRISPYISHLRRRSGGHVGYSYEWGRGFGLPAAEAALDYLAALDKAYAAASA